MSFDNQELENKSFKKSAFEQKLKQRARWAWTELVFGIVLVATAIWRQLDNEFFFAWGFALAVIGILNLRKHYKLCHSEALMRKQQIAESDERNRMINAKAQSWAFYWYVMICGTAVIVLEFMGKVQLATTLALSICLLIVIYWISYHVLQKKY